MDKLWCHFMIFFFITKHNGKLFGFENVLFGLGMDCQTGKKFWPSSFGDF
jgi:hypothetical protein